MKKRLMQGLALTLICLLAMAAPSAAALPDTILLNETDDGVEVSVKLAEKTADKILSLSISFQINYTEGDGKGNGADFVFDEALSSVVQEYRYNPDNGILTLYISGRDNNLFTEQELVLGTLELAEPETGTLTAQIGVAGNRMELVNDAHDAFSGAVSVSGSEVISLGTPPQEPETPSQEPETPPQEPESPPQESETPPAAEGGGNEMSPAENGGHGTGGNGGSEGGGNTNEGGGSSQIPGKPVSGVKLPQTNTTVRPGPGESAGESSGAETTASLETEETTESAESEGETVSTKDVPPENEGGFTAVDGELSAQSGTNFLLFAGIVLAVLLVVVGGCIVFDRRRRAARHRRRLARHHSQTGSGSEKTQAHKSALGEPHTNTSAGSHAQKTGRPHKKE